MQYATHGSITLTRASVGRTGHLITITRVLFALRRFYTMRGFGNHHRFDESMEPKIRAYSASIQGFQKNKHADMPAELRELAAQRLARVFEAQGYKR